jgi:hypothetical protein
MGKDKLKRLKSGMWLDWVQLAQDRTQLVVINTEMILRDPQKGGNSKDQRLKKDLVPTSGNLVVEFHHVFNYSTDPDGNSPSCSTPRNNVSWADNRQDILQSVSLDDDKTSYDYSLPAPCIFKLMQVVSTTFCITLLKT